MNAVEFLVSHNAKAKRNRVVNIKLHDQVKAVQTQALDPVRQESLVWRGHGGRHPTHSSVAFDRQLDKVAIWLEQWDHDTKCAILEAILRHSGYNQFQFLATVLQPSLHRDFMYAASIRFPDIDFKPISTHVSRELKEKLTRLRLDTFHRVNSAYLDGVDGLKLPNLCKDSRESLLESSRKKSKAERHRLSKSLTGSCSTLSVGSEGLLTDRIYPDTTRSVQSESVSTRRAVARFIDMPVRRHIQDENCPRKAVKKSKPSKDYESLLSSDRDQPGVKSTWSSRDADIPEEGMQLLKWYTNSWNDMKKNEFLHKVLLKLDQRQHYFLSSILAHKQHKDFIMLLPEHLSLKILSYLSPKELVVVGRVCKSWQTLANHNSLWEAKCREVKLEVPVSDDPIWKRVFRDNLNLHLNWNSGTCRITDFRGHTQSVLTVTFDKTRIASGSGDKTIRVWNIQTGQLLHVLRGHTKGVWCLQFFTKHLLISGSFDSTIKIWNLRTGNTSRTLLSHSGPVWALARHGSLLASVSQDRTAKVWNINRCRLLHTLTGHNAAIFSVDMNESGSMVVTGSADRSVRLWSTETGKCQKVIWISPSTSVMALSYSQGYFACSYGNTICLYRGTKLVKTFNEHYKRVETLQLRIVDAETGEGMLVSGGQDAMVKYWDVSKDSSIQTFAGHAEMVSCIHFDELRIASGSHDNKLRLWDFNI